MVQPYGLPYLLPLFLLPCARVSALLCYQCGHNQHVPKCESGYQWYYSKQVCPTGSYCAKYVSVDLQSNETCSIRGCASKETLSGVVHKLGCHSNDGPEHLASSYCFCNTDLCNGSTKLSGGVFLLNTAWMALLFPMLKT